MWFCIYFEFQTGERRDKALKELRDQLATKQNAEVAGDTNL